MMRFSTQTIVGLAGLVLLMATVQIAASLRRDDWSVLLDTGGWLWSTMPAAFMGAWGWITLYFSRQSSSRLARKGLIGLAVVYFGVMALLSYDIVAHGNSTSGIAFFLLPGVATVIMLPAIAIIAWLGWKIDEARID